MAKAKSEKRDKPKKTKKVKVTQIALLSDMMGGLRALRGVVAELKTEVGYLRAVLLDKPIPSAEPNPPEDAEREAE
jgi:CRISPR/Cas system CSM-associated protein Csm4 (group 5 of RAMP superfamily)